jgi:hypothetical protein
VYASYSSYFLSNFPFLAARKDLHDSHSGRRVQAARDLMASMEPLTEEAYQAHIAEYTMFRSILLSKISSLVSQHDHYSTELQRLSKELALLISEEVSSPLLVNLSAQL